MVKNENFVVSLLKCALISIIFILLSTLLFSLIINLFSLNDGVIKPVNYLVKSLAVFLSCYYCINGEKGILKGAIFGVFVVVAVFLLFSILSGGFNIDLYFVWDILLGLVVGMIAGILAVNKKSN